MRASSCSNGTIHSRSNSIVGHTGGLLGRAAGPHVETPLVQFLDATPDLVGVRTSSLDPRFGPSRCSASATRPTARIRPLSQSSSASGQVEHHEEGIFHGLQLVVFEMSDVLSQRAGIHGSDHLA
jgi:hypothetical protein